MDRPEDAQVPRRQAKQAEEPAKDSPPSYRSLYLILYNFVSALLWAVVLGRVLTIAPLHGHRRVHDGVGDFVKWTQTLAILEVFHAAIGLVRAPILTTVMQVASRFLLVWGVVQNFPAMSARSAAYSTMLLAWSITEVVRYSYFAANIGYGRVPAWLTWLRYNAFFLLYPMGISSECWLIWSSIEPAKPYNAAWEWVLKAILFVYIPGSYILFTHMMTQRRKVMRSLDSKKAS